MNQITPIHAGEILLEEFMQPFKLSQNALRDTLPEKEKYSSFVMFLQ